ncbi:MAG: fibronectin type III domain-containing protein [Eubacterium sp.]|nr:fibronectin type III domain-containing protein [Eubacterium sp.]
MKRIISFLLAITLFASALSVSLSVFAATTAPKGVTAYAVSQTGVTVKWNKVSGASKYYVFQSAKKDGKYKKVATVKKTSAKIKSLKKNKAYFFKVKAVKNGSEGAFSKIVKTRTHKSYDKAALCEAYCNAAKQLIGAYGAPEVREYFTTSDTQKFYLSGVSSVFVSDLNNDGIPELTVAYSKTSEYKNEYEFHVDGDFMFDIFTFNNGGAVKVFTGTQLYDGQDYGAGYYVSFLNKNRSKYALQYEYTLKKSGFIKKKSKNGEFATLTVSGNKMKIVDRYQYDNEKGTPYKNGKSISEKDWSKSTWYGNNSFGKKYFTQLNTSCVSRGKAAEYKAQLESTLSALENKTAV